MIALPPRASDLDHFTSTPTPPEWRQRPVGTTRAPRPAFLRKQKDLKHKRYRSSLVHVELGGLTYDCQLYDI